MQHNFKRGIKESFPIMLGFIPFAMVLGAQGAQKGMHYYELGALTGLNFAGGSEFTAISLWTNPTNIALIVAMSVLVNSPYYYGRDALSLYEKYSSLKSAGHAVFYV